jgi:hypothetical protein
MNCRVKTEENYHYDIFLLIHIIKNLNVSVQLYNNNKIG